MATTENLPVIKCYFSLDFKATKSRIEPNKVDPYAVHLEDYENINDLIARSIRTKTTFTPDHNSNAVYDTDSDIEQQLLQEDNLSPSADVDGKQNPDAAEQSEGKSGDVLPEDGQPVTQ